MGSILETFVSIVISSVVWVGQTCTTWGIDANNAQSGSVYCENVSTNKKSQCGENNITSQKDKKSNF